jgi:beta-phosphoglucomutase family hydrolase
MAYGLSAAIRGCLFDLDGVLTSTAALHAAAWKTTFDAYLANRARADGSTFVPFDEAADYSKYVDGKPRTEGARDFLAARRIDVPPGDADDPPDAETIGGLGNRKNEAFERLLREQGVAPYEGSTRYLHAVREGGLRTAIVSSSRHGREVVAAAGIGDLFDTIIDGNVAREMGLAGKPAPDTYLAAARALGVASEQASVFEDAIAGVEAGRAGHFGYVVGVDRIGQSGELRRHGANVVVNDLAELLGRP